MCLLTSFQLLCSLNYSVLFIHDGISRCDTSNFNCSSLSNSKFTLECKGERIHAILLVFWYINVCPKSPKFPTPGSGENFEKVTSHFCVAPMTWPVIPSDWFDWFCNLHGSLHHGREKNPNSREKNLVPWKTVSKHHFHPFSLAPQWYPITSLHFLGWISPVQAPWLNHPSTKVVIWVSRLPLFASVPCSSSSRLQKTGTSLAVDVAFWWLQPWLSSPQVEIEPTTVVVWCCMCPLRTGDSN